MIKMRAKLCIGSITQYQGSETISFHAVAKTGGYTDDGTDEDNAYARDLPSASLEINITNPALIGQFKPGEKFYVDFTPADK